MSSRGTATVGAVGTVEGAAAVGATITIGHQLWLFLELEAVAKSQTQTPKPKPKIQNHFASSTHKKTMKSNDKRKCDQLQFVNFNGQNGVAVGTGVGVGVVARELQLQLLCICG